MIKMKAKDFKNISCARLRGNWGIPMLTTLVASILGVFGYGSYSGSSVSEEDLTGSMNESFREFSQTPAGRFVTRAFMLFVTVFAIWSIIRFVIGGAIELGYRKYTLNVVDGAPAGFTDLFSYIKTKLIDGFLLQLVTDVYTLLWACLFLIPGIIKAYSYCMAPFIMAENPYMKPREAIKRSKELMNGNKWRLFCLEISFIGWHFLGAITFNIAEIWINPYKQISIAAFYRQICLERVKD